MSESIGVFRQDFTYSWPPLTTPLSGLDETHFHLDQLKVHFSFMGYDSPGSRLRDRERAMENGWRAGATVGSPPCEFSHISLLLPVPPFSAPLYIDSLARLEFRPVSPFRLSLSVGAVSVPLRPICLCRPTVKFEGA